MDKADGVVLVTIVRLTDIGIRACCCSYGSFEYTDAPLSWIRYGVLFHRQTRDKTNGFSVLSLQLINRSIKKTINALSESLDFEMLYTIICVEVLCEELRVDEFCLGSIFKRVIFWPALEFSECIHNGIFGHLPIYHIKICAFRKTPCDLTWPTLRCLNFSCINKWRFASNASDTLSRGESSFRKLVHDNPHYCHTEDKLSPAFVDCKYWHACA